MALTDAEINALKPDCTAAAAIEAKAENVAVGKTKLEFARCFALAVLAGMFIASGALFMTYVKSDPALPFAVSQVFGAAMFSLGLIMVIVAGAELFTGNNLMVMAALSKKITWGQVLKNWVVVYVGNLLGSLVIVCCAFGANCAGMNGGEVGSTMMTVAAGKIGLAPSVIIFRGIMCNFLVCMAVWMGFAGRTVIDKIFTSAFPVTAFVAMGFEHCVANMFFLPMGLVAKLSGVAYTGTANIDLITVGGIVYNIGFATLGNIIGGAVFVGVMYWIAYAKRKAE
ncbi:MAG: formate/nitrite transporter family protein [Coriobacteriia bacterium]|nr:formate/nitrite transporter family protein [Coriobacteriia bacterium]